MKYIVVAQNLDSFYGFIQNKHLNKFAEEHRMKMNADNVFFFKGNKLKEVEKSTVLETLDTKGIGDVMIFNAEDGSPIKIIKDKE